MITAGILATLARFSKPITVLRATIDTFTNGVRAPGAKTPIATSAAVQPAEPSDIQRLPEGVRSHEAVTVWAPILLNSANDRTGLVADQIQLSDGRTYEVARPAEWFSEAGFCKAVCTRLEG